MSVNFHSPEVLSEVKKSIYNRFCADHPTRQYLVVQVKILILREVANWQGLIINWF